MPDLFSALACSNSEMLRSQVALLESVNTSNALLPSAQTGLKRGAKAINWAAALFGKEALVEEPIITQIKDRVRDAVKSHQWDPPGHLLNLIRASCIGRSGTSPTASDTSLSIAIIDEAAALYKLDDWLTPAEKVEAIAVRHKEKLLSDLRKAIAKMSPAERAELEKQISRDLASLSHEQREAIQRDMNLDNLSGEAMTRALLSMGGPLASMTAVSTAGFGAYLALTTIIHAVATTALGITLPFAVYTSATSALSILTGPVGWVLTGIAMMFTWHFSERMLSRTLFAGLVTLASEHMQLPSSFKAPSLRLDSVRTDEAADSAVALDEEVRKTSQTVEIAMHRLSAETQKLNASQVARERALQSAERARLTMERDDARTKEQDAVLKRDLDRAENLALQEMIKGDEYRKQIAQMNTEIARLRNFAHAAALKGSSFDDGEAKILWEFWAIHFPKFVFDRDVVKFVVRRRHKERLVVEKKLMELHSCKDPAAMSKGKMKSSTGAHHFGFRLDTVECRLYYQPIGARIRIIELKTNQDAH